VQKNSVQMRFRHLALCVALAVAPGLTPPTSLPGSTGLQAQSPPRRPRPRAAPAPESAEARAVRIHRDAIVLDSHIDTTAMLASPGWTFMDRHEPGRGEGASHVDLPRMREGGLDAAFFSIYMPGTVTGAEAVKRSLVLIDHVKRLAEQHPNEIVLATTAAEVRGAHKAGRVAALMGMEGGHMIDESLAVLRDYHRLGVRYLTLTHSVNTAWADSSGDKLAHDGLTEFGKDVVRELNRLGVMVDISHTADKTFWDALEVSRAPLVASHSSARALADHPRNMSDEMITALAAKGGVIQINFFDQFLDNDVYQATVARQAHVQKIRTALEQRYPGEANAGRRQQELQAVQTSLPPLPAASWERIVEHIDHVVKLVGPTHVGLGSDFDGATMPRGMEDCSQLPKITAALLQRGYSEPDVRNILGENLLRVMEQVEAVAKTSSQ
jgi:membrane dipeptidase